MLVSGVSLLSWIIIILTYRCVCVCVGVLVRWRVGMVRADFSFVGEVAVQGLIGGLGTQETVY